ncbi:hypothetical protein ABB37_09460 [Leptomonas pyrrhocoris]|uniref:C2H2-type domain-containing protein n=1 Tax=Leptomonas pyrrhocoris TaxID=157538 RepID=A0A0M9FQY3_LEPPY|nr:hypothetical protein ABB37_09460 [Leptomonas pyrrhocoris]KPA74207.1 hypothetical protein ABB37_09460 [Leptomonas pyrrhocoris]|eukprot:XP_015652646.1 hypothetical protein ABB37_09460 [Leptomonas pyrrhocoris]
MGPKKSHASAGYMIHLVCPHCAKEFNGNSSTSGVRSNYRRHLLVHTGERPFPCPYCHDGFTTMQNMRRHIAAFHARHLTPPNGAQKEADNVEPVAPMPPLELPTATVLSSSPAASSTSSRHGKPITETGSVEPNGLTSSSLTGSQTVSERAFDGACQRQQQIAVERQEPPAVFICEDCELEVSSQAKLRRHQRYYCPFRDNIFTDPVQDALNRYRAAQELREDEESSGDSNSAGSDVLSTESGGNRRDSPVRRHRRRSKKNTSVLVLSKEEKDYLTRVAAQSGLKFVEDAYASNSGSDDTGQESDSSSSHAEASESEGDADTMPPLRSRHHADRKGRCGKSLSPHRMLSSPIRQVSPKRTPLHGSLPSPDKRPSQSPPFQLTRAEGVTASSGAPRKGCDRREGSDDEEGGVGLDGDLLRLHFHRRGSGHKRERHILQRRLRAQEGALLGLTNSPPRRPQKRHRADPTWDVRGEARADDGARASTTSSVMAPPLQELQQSPNPTSLVVSEHLLSRADSLLRLSWSPAYRNKTSVTYEVICPYCNDFSVFPNRRQLSQHMRRMHPAETARNAERAVAHEPAKTDDYPSPPS